MTPRSLKLAVLAIGSRGDVQPYCALAAGLRRAGHQVRLGTNRTFEPMVEELGLEFSPLEGDFNDILRSEVGRLWVSSGSNPLRFTRGFRELMQVLLEKLAHDTAAACREVDAVIGSPMALGLAGMHQAERMGVSCIAVSHFPSMPTRAFPHVLAPGAVSLGGFYNWATHILLTNLMWLAMRTQINRVRRHLLNLPISAVLHRHTIGPKPFLHGFSSAVVPRPADWPAWSHVTGYWFLDVPEWQPPPPLADFLASGSPPVYVGFGSMPSRTLAQMLDLAVGALRKAGRRGIVMPGSVGLEGGRDQALTRVNEDVLVVESIPHGWLFPRVAAVVHHGGAGTTGEGLRAGRPTVITPFFADQPFWGQVVKRLGAGPSPIPIRRLTSDRLAAAIREATTNPSIAARAADIGKRIREENGVARAVQLLVEAVHRR